MEFKSFQKIPRITNEQYIITEKIDGTNAVIAIGENGEFYTGSRNRWITPGDDNFGFSSWAHENKEELLKLGVGYHYGEWYGSGIQRGYNLNEKRFMLFNTLRWGHHNPNTPNCCEVATLLPHVITECVELLKKGSIHIPGYERTEGFVIYTKLTNQLYKYIIEK